MDKNCLCLFIKTITHNNIITFNNLKNENKNLQVKKQ